jgi:MoaA/NifB/PqqE/SkfB family radical SAM enzyme
MIRKIYKDFIVRKIKEEGAGWLVKRAGQYMLLHLSSLLGKPLCGPVHGSIMVTYRCNYNCVMCDFPQKCVERVRADEQELGTDKFRHIIGEFARIGTPGIGFTGGEPMLRSDIYDLMACTRQHKMITHLNTNGYFIDDAAAVRLIQIGVDSVNISLDGAKPETHDRIRNYTGAFERATAAVGRLNRLRQKQGVMLRIKNVAVIDETNLDEVPELIHLSRELGADCIEFIPRQPFAAADLLALRTVPADALLLDKVDKMVEYISNAAKEGFGIENSPAHLRLLRSSFAGIPSPVRCRAGYNSLLVDCYGDVFTCFPFIGWGKPAGNIRDGSLVELWNSPDYQKHRDSASGCHDCYLNGQLELNLLFDHKIRMGW